MTDSMQIRQLKVMVRSHNDESPWDCWPISTAKNNANICRNAISSSLCSRSNMEKFLQVWDNLVGRRIVSDPQAALRVPPVFIIQPHGQDDVMAWRPLLDIPFPHGKAVLSWMPHSAQCFSSSFTVQILFLKLLRTRVKMKARSSRRCFWEFPDRYLPAWTCIRWLS